VRQSSQRFGLYTVLQRPPAMVSLRAMADESPALRKLTAFFKSERDAMDKSPYLKMFRRLLRRHEKPHTDLEQCNWAEIYSWWRKKQPKDKSS
jgi:hypothetical protein